jgi:hypothetical protein
MKAKDNDKEGLIIHSMGSIGKSTLAAVLIQPRFGGQLFSIETANKDAERYGQSVRRYTAEQ